MKSNNSFKRLSVLYREPKLLKVLADLQRAILAVPLSVLYREPKLLKGYFFKASSSASLPFSALP